MSPEICQLSQTVQQKEIKIITPWVYMASPLRGSKWLSCSGFLYWNVSWGKLVIYLQVHVLMRKWSNAISLLSNSVQRQLFQCSMYYLELEYEFTFFRGGFGRWWRWTFEHLVVFWIRCLLPKPVSSLKKSYFSNVDFFGGGRWKLMDIASQGCFTIMS